MAFQSSRLSYGVSMIALIMAAATGANATTIGLQVGAGQSITNSGNLSADYGVQFSGDGGTFTNASGATVDANIKMLIGDSPSAKNVNYNNLTINNAGTMQYGASPAALSYGSGTYFGGNAIVSGSTQTGVASVSGITINNAATGIIAGLDSSPGHDDVPISFEDGTAGAVVNNSGIVSTVGGSESAAAIRVMSGLATYLSPSIPTTTSNVVITNNAGGLIENTGAGMAVSIQESGANGVYNGVTSNVTVNNDGTIKGGTSTGFGDSAAITIGAATQAITGTPGNLSYGPITPGIANTPGVAIVNTGIIDGSASGVAIGNSANTAAMSVTNSGTIKGNINLGTGGDSITLTGGAVLGAINGRNAGDTLSFNAGAGNFASVAGAIANVTNIAVESGNAIFAHGPTGFSSFSVGAGDAANIVSDLQVGIGAALSGGGVFIVAGDFLNHSTQNLLWSTDNASLNFSGNNITHQLLLTGLDEGANSEGYDNNFAWGDLFISGTNSLSLGDGLNAGGNGVALYLNGIAGALISGDDITNIAGNGLNIYYDADLRGNGYLGGLTYNLANGGQLIGLDRDVPEPASMALLGAGLAGLGVLRRRTRA